MEYEPNIRNCSQDKDFDIQIFMNHLIIITKYDNTTMYLTELILSLDSTLQQLRLFKPAAYVHG